MSLSTIARRFLQSHDGHDHSGHDHDDHSDEPVVADTHDDHDDHADHADHDDHEDHADEEGGVDVKTFKIIIVIQLCNSCSKRKQKCLISLFSDLVLSAFSSIVPGISWHLGVIRLIKEIKSPCNCKDSGPLQQPQAAWGYRF